MPSIRIDKVVFSSLHGAFINYATLTDDIVVEATPISDGSSRTITVVIPYERGGTVADIYATRGSVRSVVSGGGRAAASEVYDSKSNESVTFGVSYNSNDIMVSFTIDNFTGDSLTPNAQTITISVVQYDAPVTSV